MRKWLPLIAVCMGTFMLLVDVTIVNVALPDMAVDLRTSFTSLAWVVDAYALVLAALVLGAGAIGDIVGHRRTYIGGLALFAVASLVCGIAPNAGLLIAARAAQGIGGAAMFATTVALLNSSYSGRDRGTAFGLWGATAGASAAVGPIIGGFLTEGLSWRWIFFVNLPVSVLAISLCVFVLTDNNPPTKRRIDLLGMVTFTASAASLTYAMIRANEHGWSDLEVIALLAAGAVLLAVFAAIETHSDHAMFDMALLRNRSFTGVLIASLALNFAAFASFTYTSIWLQSVLGLSPIQAGLTGLPLSVASFTVAALIGRVLHKAAPGPLIGAGMLLIGAGGLVELVLLRDGASWPSLIPGFLLIGVGVGLATPTLNSAALSAVPVQRGGMAGGSVNTGRQLGYALGIASLGTVFASGARSTLADRGVPGSDRVSHALAGGQASNLLRAVPGVADRARLNSALHAASLAGLQVVFLVAGVAGVLAGLIVLVMVRTPGAHESAVVGDAAVTPPDLGADAQGSPGGGSAGAHEPAAVGAAAVTPAELAETAGREDDEPAPV